MIRCSYVSFLFYYNCTSYQNHQLSQQKLDTPLKNKVKRKSLFSKSVNNKSCRPRLKNDLENLNFEIFGGSVDNFGTRFEK